MHLYLPQIRNRFSSTSDQQHQQDLRELRSLQGDPATFQQKAFNILDRIQTDPLYSEDGKVLRPFTAEEARHKAKQEIEAKMRDRFTKG